MAHQYRTLERMLQFADIPRPGMPEQQLHRRRGDPRHRLPEFPRIPHEEMPGQEGNIFHPVAKGRHLDPDHVETVEEVLPESPGLHFLLEAAVG